MGRVSQRVDRQGATWWSLAAEARALGVPGVAHAAYLGVPGPEGATRAVLCVEVDGDPAGPAIDPELAELLRAALAPAPVDEIHRLEAIPRDPRHASKTDLGRLREMIG